MEKEMTPRPPMHKRARHADLIVTVHSDKRTRHLHTVSIYDVKADCYKPESFIENRGISWFLDLADLKETLNWNLGGDPAKYCFQWGTPGTGYAYITH